MALEAVLAVFKAQAVLVVEVRVVLLLMACLAL